MPSRIPSTPEARSLTGQIAVNTRHRGAGDPLVVELRRAKAVADLDEFIRRTVESAPPLTAAQRDRLVALLRPIPAAGGDAA